jgi:hypothetical protein
MSAQHFSSFVAVWHGLGTWAFAEAVVTEVTVQVVDLAEVVVVEENVEVVVF